MRCKTVLTRIDAFRTNELAGGEAREVHEHIGKCHSCEESLNDVVALARSVRSIGVEPPKSIRATLTSTDAFDVVDADGRPLFVAFSSRGLRMIHTGSSEQEFRIMYGERFGRELVRAALPERLRRQVSAAVKGKGVNQPVVDLEGGDFEQTVLGVLTRIPRGEVRTYSWVAQQAGRPKAVRAVGTICARNVVPFVVPCHRVVPAAGGVGNYAFGSEIKRALLEREGVPVDELEEMAKKRIRFVGSQTTHIFCFPTCRDARRIRDDNRIPFHDEEEAAKKGFRPCKRCQPAAA
jgi:O-6-methylguanine DNA methyltransferase